MKTHRHRLTSIDAETRTKIGGDLVEVSMRDDPALQFTAAQAEEYGNALIAAAKNATKPSRMARFVGGKFDGKTMEDHGGLRCLMRAEARETYKRTGRDSDGVAVFTFEKVEIL